MKLNHEVAKRELQMLMSGEYGPPPAFKPGRGRKAHSPVRAPHRGSTRTGKFVVRGKSGKVAGRYHTKAEAEHRIAQLKANAERLRAFRFGKR